ncbi:MAG TPA: sialidase family protein [Pyrinomonadaceae bacterium]|nr:sialidase family protein [Pyrinomonadaceae bacterium]
MSTKRVLLITFAALLMFLAGCAQRAKQIETTAQPPDTLKPVRVSAESADAAEPAVATARDGTAYVAWVEHRETEADVMLAQLDAGGEMKGAPVRVNPQAGVATAWRGDPPTVKVASDGTVYVGWTARVGGPQGHGNDLYISASRDGGRTFDAPVKVNDDREQVVHGMHSLAVGSDGRVLVAWLDERNVQKQQPSENQMKGMQKMEHMEANREVFFASSADGGRTFSQNIRIAKDACPCCKTAVVVGADGHVFVGWRQVLPGEFRHIAVAASEDGGKRFAPPVIVSDDRWAIAACPVSGPTLIVGDDNHLSVVWYTEGEKAQPGLYSAESVDGGKTFSESSVFAKGEARGTPLLLKSKDKGIAVVWESDDGTSARVMRALLVDSDKSADSVQMISSSGELPSAATVGDQLFVGYIAKTGEHRSIWVVRAKSKAEEKGKGEG